MIGRLLIILVLSSPFAAAAEQTLYWRDMTVTAQLDADGRLHVEERQSMVFNGNWNGGARTFNLRLGQSLHLESLMRVDSATGQEIELSRGSLSEIDEYKWIDTSHLRWRSRLPTDPAFDNKEITYVLRYTLSNILVPEDSRYLLDHDFAFPDRSGMIEKFSLSLTLDPVWKPMQAFEGPTGFGPIPPGRGYLVTIPLRYEGSGKPAAARAGLSFGVRGTLLIILFVAIPVLISRFYQREKALGRFAPLLPASSINRGWIETNILQYPPELVGTIWDESVGSAEVAAVLARLVLEGKLRSEVRGKSKHSGVLHLWKQGGGFEGYEVDLVNALFYDGGNETNTERVKAHYESSGFDPASKIRKPLEIQMQDLLATSGTGSKPSWKKTFALVAAGVALIVIGVLSAMTDRIAGLPDLAAGIIGAASVFVPYIPAIVLACLYRKRLVRLRLHFIMMMIPMTIMTGVFTVAMLLGPLPISAWVAAGVMVLLIAAFNSVLNAAMSRENQVQILFRQKFAAAREYFRLQLAQANPELQDAWYPYLLAFGLGDSVDEWFHSFGGQETEIAHTIGSTGSFTGSGGGSRSWSGGGGAFGGAGASASWAAVAGTMAAGVAAPSSSGSSGGGGGGHSGGGGGGGW